MARIGEIDREENEDGLRKIIIEIYKDFTQDTYDLSPPGIDAPPLPGDQGVSISIDGSSGKHFHIGIYPDPEAEPGEIRFYSRDEDGNKKAFLHLKKDGKHYFNGGSGSAVKFSELDTGLQSQASLINAELVKIATAITGIGGSYVPGTVSVDISSSEVDEVLLP